MSFQDLPDILTIDEVAKFLRIGRNSAYALTRQWRITGGREGLGCVPVGRGLRVPKAALERFLAGS
jgi:excisionase family DNA binding protein